ncbi:MAG: hypothetical protein V4463_18750 [Pseudomonadota bacterium]
MRNAFEAWAQRDGHIVRRREDKPDEYLVFETQRRWVIWQAALAHGKSAAATTKYAAQKTVAKETAAEPVRASAPKVTAIVPDEAAVRNKVLNEVLDAFSDLDDTAGIEGILKVIQSLKKKQKALAEEKVEDKAEG